jgi:uncharacterized protein Veg
MIKSNGNISQIRESISRLYENPVEVTLNLGRNKFVKFNATLSGVYPALFTVTPVDKSFKGKTTYSYSEYLCGRVRLNPVQNNAD